MRHHLIGMVAVLTAGLLGVAPVANANTMLTEKLTLSTSTYTSYPGGEFTASNLVGFGNTLQTQATSLGSGTFETFCVEIHEEFTSGHSYWVNPNLVSLNSDVPLCTDTAYLFTHFSAGDLGQFDFSASGRKASDGSLQNAIWYFQNQVTLSQISGDTLANKFITEAKNAVSSGQWSGTGHVAILNLWANQDATGAAQDQLCLLQTPPSVPLPSPLWAAAALLAPIIGCQLRARALC